jgi:hypothetical protein
MPASWNPLRRLFNPVHPIPSGIYHYQSPPSDPRNYRLHLRLEEPEGGILVVNASTILHLNRTAAEYAYYLVQNAASDEVAKQMAARYHVTRQQARQDYLDLADRIQVLIETPDLDPVNFLDFERRQPHSGHISAPYRLDCALTYRLPTDEPVDAAPIERVSHELSTEEWFRIMDKAWDFGIPHLVFTGGEPTLRDDLPDLIAHAQNTGQVAGVITEGLRLADETYLGRLLQAGLDHLLLVLRPEEEQSWQAVGNSLVEDLAVTVHLTITAENAGQAAACLERLKAMGTRYVSLSAEQASLQPALQAARDRAAVLDLEQVWNLPVPYYAHNPVALEAGSAALEGAGKAFLYIEPDGDVRPTQGHPQILGNILHAEWPAIWRG